MVEVVMTVLSFFANLEEPSRPVSVRVSEVTHGESRFLWSE